MLLNRRLKQGKPNQEGAIKRSMDTLKANQEHALPPEKMSTEGKSNKAAAVQVKRE